MFNENSIQWYKEFLPVIKVVKILSWTFEQVRVVLKNFPVVQVGPWNYTQDSKKNGENWKWIIFFIKNIFPNSFIIESISFCYDNP